MDTVRGYRIQTGRGRAATRLGRIAAAVSVAVLLAAAPVWAGPAADAMAGVEGCALVMDLETGEVVDSYRLEQAAARAYPSSSVLKPVVALGALHYGVLSADEEIRGDREGYLKRYGDCLMDYMRYDRGALTLAEALARSDNVYFYTVGARLGAQRVRTLYRSFGFGSVTGLAPGTETPGRVAADPKGVAALHFLGWGSKGTRITAAQLAVAMAAFGNGGRQLRPFTDGREPKVVSTIHADEATFKTVNDCLRRVVAEGTGKSADIDGVAVYGKTGSISIPESGVPIGVFAGFTQGLPRDVAFALIEEGAYSPRAVRLAKGMLEGIRDRQQGEDAAHRADGEEEGTQ